MHGLSTFMSRTALLWRLLIISSNQRPLCSIQTIIKPCSSHVVSFEYVAFQVTHTCDGCHPQLFHHDGPSAKVRPGGRLVLSGDCEASALEHCGLVARHRHRTFRQVERFLVPLRETRVQKGVKPFGGPEVTYGSLIAQCEKGQLKILRTTEPSCPSRVWFMLRLEPPPPPAAAPPPLPPSTPPEVFASFPGAPAAPPPPAESSFRTCRTCQQSLVLHQRTSMFLRPISAVQGMYGEQPKSRGPWGSRGGRLPSLSCD